MVADNEELENFESAQHRRTVKPESIRFDTVRHPQHHPHFLLFCNLGIFNTDFEKKKKLVEKSMFPSVFLMFS